MSPRLLLLVAPAAVLAGCAAPEVGVPEEPTPEAGPPDLLVVVLDTTSTLVLDEAMPTAAGFVEDALRWERAVSPSNSTVDSVAAVFQDRFLLTSDLAPGGDSTAETTLAEKLRAAGYGTVLVSANETLDMDMFARGFDFVRIKERSESAGGADRRAVEAFVEAWEATEQPRFGWIQLLAGHDYLGAPGDAPWPPRGDEELDRAWGWHTDDARDTDALLPALLDLVPREAGLTVLTADHGELFANRGPFMIGAPASFGHGEANSPLEIEVPLALRGPGLPSEERPGAAAVLNLHGTLLAAAGLGGTGDLRDGTGHHPPGSALCNLLNQGRMEGGGNMSVWVQDDGVQLVRTHPPERLDEGEMPPLVARWPARGVGYRPDWEELTLTDLTAEQTQFLFDTALPECKGFEDLCEDYPELEAIGYIVCD